MRYLGHARYRMRTNLPNPSWQTDLQLEFSISDQNYGREGINFDFSGSGLRDLR